MRIMYDLGVFVYICVKASLEMKNNDAVNFELFYNYHKSSQRPRDRPGHGGRTPSEIYRIIDIEPRLPRLHKGVINDAKPLTVPAKDRKSLGESQSKITRGTFKA